MIDTAIMVVIGIVKVVVISSVAVVRPNSSRLFYNV